MNPLHIGESLSLVLVDAAAKGTLLLAAACLATIGLRRSSAAMRHRVWGLTMGGLVLLPVLSWLLPAWRLPILPAPTKQAASPAFELETESDRPLLTQERNEDPPNDGIAFTRSAGIEEIRPAMSADSLTPVLSPVVSNLSTPSTPVEDDSKGATWIFACAACVWGLGTALLLAGVAIGVRRTGRLWHESQSIIDEDWSRLSRELCRRLGLRRVVHLREHAEPVVPLTWGLLRPIILLPQQARRWSSSMRRAVLLHELAHVHRGDVAYQLLGRFACALYWFHPLAWFGLHRLRQEREQACDDAVIGSGERASDYAEQLLEVARRYRRAGGLALAVEITRGGSLEQRVRALFDAARSHAPVGRRLAVSLLSVTGLFVTSIAVLHPVVAESPAVTVQITVDSNTSAPVADQSQSPAPKKASTAELSPKTVTVPATDNVDHLLRFNDNLTRARRLVFLAKPQEALKLLEEAIRELPLVSDEQLMTDDYRRFGNDADRIRSRSQEQLIDCLLSVGGLDQAAQVANKIRSPGIQAEALSKIAVKLAALGRRDAAVRSLDQALTVAPKEKPIPEEFAKFWGDQEATWQLMGLLDVGDACHALGEIDRYDQVVRLMQKVRGKNEDALSLLLRIAHRQWEQRDKPGMQQTLVQITEACERPEGAADIIAGFWNDVCSTLLESGKFDDVVPHLDKLADNRRDRTRAALVRGWSRSNQMERAAEELKRINEPGSRATAMVFLARGEAAAGRKDAAARLLTEATDLVRGETNPFVKIEPLVLAVETLAQWGDYDAAERDANQVNATIPADALMYFPYGDAHSDYFEMPYQILVGPQTSWLLIARAQVRAGKIDEAKKTIERIADIPGAPFMLDRFRGYILGLVAREWLRSGDRDRVRKLLANESSPAVREAIEAELTAVEPNLPARTTSETQTESAAQILQKVVDKNRFWLNPRPKSLRYTLTGGKPEPDDNDKMVHQVSISGEKVRWEMDANVQPAGKSTVRTQEYTTLITPEETVWLRPKGAKTGAMTNVSDSRRFRQGMTWQTAFHAIAAGGVPAKCRLVEETETKEGRVVVLEVEFDKAWASVGLGMYQLQYGAANWRMKKVRLHVRLPDYLPMREEYFDLDTEKINNTTVSFGPEFIKVGENLAPKTMRYVQISDDAMQRRSKFREWALEGQFHEIKGIWLLDKATNSQDGKIVRLMQVSEVSTAPILPNVFDPLAPLDDQRK